MIILTKKCFKKAYEKTTKERDELEVALQLEQELCERFEKRTDCYYTMVRNGDNDRKRLLIEIDEIKQQNTLLEKTIKELILSNSIYESTLNSREKNLHELRKVSAKQEEKIKNLHSNLAYLEKALNLIEKKFT